MSQASEAVTLKEVSDFGIDISERAYRPGQIFHEMLQGMMNQILGWAPAGHGRWYREYGQLILATLVRSNVVLNAKS